MKDVLLPKDNALVEQENFVQIMERMDVHQILQELLHVHLPIHLQVDVHIGELMEIQIAELILIFLIN